MDPARPGPDDLPAALRGRLVALLNQLEQDRAALAADPEGAAVFDALIDAARRALNNLDAPQAGV